MQQEVAFFDRNRTGELINRLSTDTSLVSQCVTMNISDGLRSSIMVCAGVSMMVCISIINQRNTFNTFEETQCLNDKIMIGPEWIQAAYLIPHQLLNGSQLF